jgi:hypothetical protein
MEYCTFLRIGDNEPCHRNHTKNSKYCKYHNYLIKTSKTKPCTRCGRGTKAKYQICIRCGSQDYYNKTIKTYKSECNRFRKISLE